MGIVVKKPGVLTTVQDSGRFGYQGSGFATNGVMDHRAFAIANLLVDNDPNAPVLEFALAGPALRFTTSSIFAITGADCAPTLDGKPIPSYTAIQAHRGSILQFASVKAGRFGCIAFAGGGIDVPEVMGSRSTNLKCQLGGWHGRALKTSDYLPFVTRDVDYLPSMGSRSLREEARFYGFSKRTSGENGGAGNVLSRDGSGSGGFVSSGFGGDGGFGGSAFSDGGGFNSGSFSGDYGNSGSLSGSYADNSCSGGNGYGGGGNYFDDSGFGNSNFVGQSSSSGYNSSYNYNNDNYGGNFNDTYNSYNNSGSSEDASYGNYDSYGSYSSSNGYDASNAFIPGGFNSYDSSNSYNGYSSYSNYDSSSSYISYDGSSGNGYGDYGSYDSLNSQSSLNGSGGYGEANACDNSNGFDSASYQNSSGGSCSYDYSGSFNSYDSSSNYGDSSGFNDYSAYDNTGGYGGSGYDDTSYQSGANASFSYDNTSGFGGYGTYDSTNTYDNSGFYGSSNTYDSSNSYSPNGYESYDSSSSYNNYGSYNNYDGTSTSYAGSSDYAGNDSNASSVDDFGGASYSSVDAASANHAGTSFAPEAPQASAPCHEVTLRVVPGPQEYLFTDEGVRTFYGQPFTVTAECDRMGYRLDGPEIQSKHGSDIITDGIAFGAVQVPTHGRPIIMLADRQTTGGYAKIGTIASVDIPKLVQCPPGSIVHFQPISVQEAQRLLREQAKHYEDLAARVRQPSPSGMSPRRAARRLTPFLAAQARFVAPDPLWLTREIAAKRTAAAKGAAPSTEETRNVPAMEAPYADAGAHDDAPAVDGAMPEDAAADVPAGFSPASEAGAWEAQTTGWAADGCGQAASSESPAAASEGCDSSA